MTLQRPTLQHDTGAGHDPASTVAQSAAALAANRRLEELRRSAGVNYRQSGTGDNRAWLAELAGAGDQSAASTVEADPGAGLDLFDQWARQEAQRRRLVREGERANKEAAWQRWAASLAAEKSAAPVAPVEPRPVTTAAPVDLLAEGERLRLAGLKESDPRRFYLETLPELPDTVRAYPSLLAAARRGGRVPLMRLYLLCKALDPDGSGVVSLGQVKQYYTLKDSPYRVFTPRRLRQVLGQGVGLFWDRHTDDRLWLRSPDKIAAGLGVDHIAGAPVALPVWPLLDGHHEAAAAFYAAWHAARGDDPNPISRQTITSITGACKSSQIAYDVTADLQARRNIAIVGNGTKDQLQEAAWRYGHAFKFRDHAGKLGRRGWIYTAINLPSSYQSPYATLPKGRLRRINTALHDLVTMGRGKGNNDIRRIYFSDGAAAADAYNRDPKQDCIYRHGTGLKATAARPPKLEGVNLWTVLQGQL